MALTMEMGAGSARSLREREVRRRHALMLGASAALHLAILGPMILLAHGDEFLFDLAKDFPIIQLQLEPPEARPEVRPLPDPQKPLPVPTPQPLREQTPETPSEAVQQERLEAMRPSPEVWPVTRELPRIAEPPAPPKPETLESPTGAASLSPLDRAVPSVTPLPPQPVESLTAPGQRAEPAPLSLQTPRLETAPTVTDQEAAASSSDAPVRRRREEEERAAALAAAAAAASGPPSPPVPRLANPVPGALSPGATGGSPVPGVSDAWRVAPSSQGDRNARSLRMSPTGCRFPERLTEGERQICTERFNADAARGAERPITGSGNAARDARFRQEGAREMYRYEEQRRPLSGGSGNVGPADCPGSNLGIGCAGSLLDPSMQMDSSTNIQTKRDGPRPSGPQVPGSSGAAGRPGNGSRND